jgi:hypothetical protein
MSEEENNQTGHSNESEGLVSKAAAERTVENFQADQAQQQHEPENAQWHHQDNETGNHEAEAGEDQVPMFSKPFLFVAAASAAKYATDCPWQACIVFVSHTFLRKAGALTARSQLRCLSLRKS